MNRYGHENQPYVVPVYLAFRQASACDGPSALELARARTPDVVSVDIGMPGMDVLEVARRLRGPSSEPGEAGGRPRAGVPTGPPSVRRPGTDGNKGTRRLRPEQRRRVLHSRSGGMIRDDRPGFVRRMWAAVKRGLLGKSGPDYMKQFRASDEYWDRVIAAQLGWPHKPRPKPVPAGSSPNARSTEKQP